MTWGAPPAGGINALCGHPDFSGDSSEVQHQLQNVQHRFAVHMVHLPWCLQIAQFLFGTIQMKVVICGDSSEVQDQLLKLL